jgi:hypothetical protein
MKALRLPLIGFLAACVVFLALAASKKIDAFYRGEVPRNIIQQNFHG